MRSLSMDDLLTSNNINRLDWISATRHTPGLIVSIENYILLFLELALYHEFVQFVSLLYFGAHGGCHFVHEG